MNDINCNRDHHSRSLHLFLYSVVPIYETCMFIISSLPFLGILQTNFNDLTRNFNCDVLPYIYNIILKDILQIAFVIH